MEWICIHTSPEHSPPDLTAASGEHGESPEKIGSYSMNEKYSVVLLVSTRFWRQIIKYFELNMKREITIPNMNERAK